MALSNDQFSMIVENRIDLIRSVLIMKAKEYASDSDRLHNFNVAARMINTSKEKALLGMFLKHLVSVFDIIEKADTVHNNFTNEFIEEKIGDSINYLILLEAILKERNLVQSDL